MSGYSGGVSITQISGFNSNPITMQRVLVASDKLKIVKGGAAEITHTTNSAEFFDWLSNNNGAEIVAPVNISSGVDILNTTGRGFMGAVVLPIPATSVGDITLEITIDGVLSSITVPCNTSYRGALIPETELPDRDVTFGLLAEVRGWRVLAGATDITYIKHISKYIAEKTAIRFEQSLRVRILSATAISAAAGQNIAAVQCLKD